MPILGISEQDLAMLSFFSGYVRIAAEEYSLDDFGDRRFGQNQLKTSKTSLKTPKNVYKI